MESKEIWSAYWGIPVWEFMLEIALFWIMYLVALILVWRSK